MSEAVEAAPVAEATPAAASPLPATDAAKAALSREERAQRARSVFARAALPVPGESAKEAPPAAVEPPPLSLQTTTAAAPPPKPTESPEERIARTLQDRLSAERKVFEAEQRAKQLEADLQRERERFNALNNDPFKRAVLEGKTYEDITRSIVAKEFEPATPEQVAAQKLEARLEEERKARELLEQRWKDYDAQAEFAKRRDAVRAKLQQSSDAFPYVSALDWMTDTAVSKHQEVESQGVDLDTVLGELNQAAQKDLQSVLSSDAALKHLLSDETVQSRVISTLLADEKTKARVLAVLGPAITPKPQLPAGPATTAPMPRTDSPSAIPTRVVGESGDRVRPAGLGRDERRANARNAFRRAQGA